MFVLVFQIGRKQPSVIAIVHMFRQSKHAGCIRGFWSPASAILWMDAAIIHPARRVQKTRRNELSRLVTMLTTVQHGEPTPCAGAGSIGSAAPRLGKTRVKSAPLRLESHSAACVRRAADWADAPRHSALSGLKSFERFDALRVVAVAAIQQRALCRVAPCERAHANRTVLLPTIAQLLQCEPPARRSGFGNLAASAIIAVDKVRPSRRAG